MASYHLSVHPNVSRGKGQSLVRTAAYNGRCQLVDERTGEVWDYRHLGAALFSGMYAPKDAPDWARDLGQLANEVERFERRSDAQLAMNLDIAMPHEMTLEQNRRLMQDFVREEFQRKGYAAHVGIHAPDLEGDDRNVHAHVLVTLRKIDRDGFARTKTEQQERYRNRHEYVEQLREKWERLANRHLERNGYDTRIDRRSLQDQGIDREPERHRGPTVTAMMRENKPSHVIADISRRQQEVAEERALKAEAGRLAADEKRIDAQIIDLEVKRAERQARDAAKGQVDDIRPVGSSGRDAAAETAPEAVQEQYAQGAPSSAPGQSTTRATEPERAAEEVFSPRSAELEKNYSKRVEPAPAPAPAPAVIHLGPSVDELGHAAEQTVEKATSIGSRLLGAIGERFASMILAIADFIAPAPPPTKEQAEGMQRAAEEQQEQNAAAAQQQEIAASVDWQQFEENRKQQQADLSFAQRYGRPPTREANLDHERDDDYGRELER